MSERSELIEWIRGELVGPSRHLVDGNLTTATFSGRDYCDNVANRRGPLVWVPSPGAAHEEVLYFDRESPHRKYGVGLLHPQAASMSVSPDDAALWAADTVGVETEPSVDGEALTDEDEHPAGEKADSFAPSDDFEVTSPDIRQPSTVGISFCAKLRQQGRVIVELPQSKKFKWQEDNSEPFPLNGRYESCNRSWTDETRGRQQATMWRRQPAVPAGCRIEFNRNELVDKKRLVRDIVMPADSPLKLSVELYPRYRAEDEQWLLTVVLRNTTTYEQDARPYGGILYQTFFEIRTAEGEIQRYPDSLRPFNDLDDDEQTLELLYRESTTWGIGHGCACGWDAEPGSKPEVLYADFMPAVELPSMTPDITDANGNKLDLSMRGLANLPACGTGGAWDALEQLETGYRNWINNLTKDEILSDPECKFHGVASRHIEACQTCLTRINAGIDLLKTDSTVLNAFRLANLAMMLQQIATKQLHTRPLFWDKQTGEIRTEGTCQSPWNIYSANEEQNGLGSWRAFQIAFLLMSLKGLQDGRSPEREIVDLIWFPTGGGKTEAYLAAMAFFMFHERLLMTNQDPLRRDGTNILMRYTLRMLTTQQFQRAASLICAMEFLRRDCAGHKIVDAIPGRRFSLGLWLGRDGSPNNIDEARAKLRKFRSDPTPRNPLILTECPWCRAQIGRLEKKPDGIKLSDWHEKRIKGIKENNREPMLCCPDTQCSFGEVGAKNWLPIEVIDERIYRDPPSLLIGTADKFAMIAYRPGAGAIFGLNNIKVRDNQKVQGEPKRHAYPPGMIIQDELHLISGPLGTLYALYETIFEQLCSLQENGRWIRPKIIASTATIRGASDQVRTLYARKNTSLFPAPGLNMGDSFFGRYARNRDGNRLSTGRLYLGIHASNYGSFLTTQVRTFAAALFRPFQFATDRRDPWWTLLTFYNSLRELGGATTLFSSDIRSRLKFLFNREGFDRDSDRRHIKDVNELTSRLSQSEIVDMMNRLSEPYDELSPAIDVCLASNIIEVGVDIDRLSLMGVVGQPKTTSSYIQVTGRVGRKWWERAGLILMLYDPRKSRDRSHFEQFHSYHRRLYERVEPTTATPFAISAIQRALQGALITWARLQSNEPVDSADKYLHAVAEALELLTARCKSVLPTEDVDRAIKEMKRVCDDLTKKWNANPQAWEEFPQKPDGDYLMLWPGQHATLVQLSRGVSVPSSLRQVDGHAELSISQGYIVNKQAERREG